MWVAEKDLDKCRQCGVCDEIVACSSVHVGYMEECIGCRVCTIACPYEALEMKKRNKGKEVKVTINGEKFSLP